VVTKTLFLKKTGGGGRFFGAGGPVWREGASLGRRKVFSFKNLTGYFSFSPFVAQADDIVYERYYYRLG